MKRKSFYIPGTEIGRRFCEEKLNPKDYEFSAFHRGYLIFYCEEKDKERILQQFKQYSPDYSI